MIRLFRILYISAMLVGLMFWGGMLHLTLISVWSFIAGADVGDLLTMQLLLLAIATILMFWGGYFFIGMVSGSVLTLAYSVC